MQDGAPDQISAADYDPSLDRREDEQRRVLKDEPTNIETIEEEEEEDDVDDMFAADLTVKKRKKVKKVVVCITLVYHLRCLILCAETSSTCPYHHYIRLCLGP